jgi:hypothetical protein
MPDTTPEPPPETPQQPRAPDGWELACQGILRSEFGRRHSRALDKAMMQLSAEKAWRESRAEALRTSWWKSIREIFSMCPGLSFVAVLCLLVGGIWLFVANFHSEVSATSALASACRVADAVNARWAGRVQLKAGDNLPAGSFRLESGVVELAFSTGAKVAIEGPADFKLAGRNGLDLQNGKLSAEVPKPAIGFAVQTPNSTVVDLGTRFGINTRGKDFSEVHVFEGKIHVTGSYAPAPNNEWDLTRNMAMVLDSRGGVTETAAAETSFPQASHAVIIRPANCGFDTSGFTKIGGFPAAVGMWSGPAFTITGTVGEVRPVEGQGMLQFMPPPGGGDSVVWQLVDLRSAKEFIAANGTVDLKAWVQFNRTRSDAYAASDFKLSIAAFRGQPSDAAALWASRNQTALAYAERELTADNDPKTWERVDIATTLSAEADFAVMEIRAIAPKNVPAGVNPFPGHFADLIDAKVCLPLRPSGMVAAH